MPDKGDERCEEEVFIYKRITKNMAVKKSKRRQASTRGRIVKHPRIPKRVKIEASEKDKSE